MQKVSVIIPAYNVEKMLSICLETVLSQTYHNIEIIVVNDGSTDNTGLILDHYASVDSRIVPIHQKNAGVSAARNRALEAATGEYVVFVDSDDTVTSSYISDLMQWSDFDFVTAGYHFQTPDGEWKKMVFEDLSVMQQQVRMYPSRFLGKYYFGSPWAKLLKKNILYENKIKFNEDIHCGEDTLFILQYLFYAKKIRILPICGYHYFFYSGSLVHTKHRKMWQWKIQIEQVILEFFKPHDEMEENELCARNFGVLKGLLRDYSAQMSDSELLMIYNHPFFQKGITFMKENGNFMERMLIFAMERSNYSLYVTLNKAVIFAFRVRNTIKRMLRGE